MLLRFYSSSHTQVFSSLLCFVLFVRDNTTVSLFLIAFPLRFWVVKRMVTFLSPSGYLLICSCFQSADAALSMPYLDFIYHHVFIDLKACGPSCPLDFKLYIYLFIFVHVFSLIWFGLFLSFLMNIIALGVGSFSLFYILLCH